MCPSIFIEKRVRHRCFPRNFLRKPVFIKHLCECVLNYVPHVPACLKCLRASPVHAPLGFACFRAIVSYVPYLPSFLGAFICFYAPYGPHFFRALLAFIFFFRAFIFFTCLLFYVTLGFKCLIRFHF